MKLTICSLVLITVVLSYLIGSVHSQTTSSLLTAATTTGCQLVKTSTVLGYKVSSTTKIYLNACSGSCLSTSGSTTECLAYKQTITVATKMNTRNTKQVTQVTSCSCTAAPCSVTIDGVTTWYDHGTTVIDACGSQCTCSFGTLVNCCRQRKEFRLGMTAEEKTRFLNAYYTVFTNPAYSATFRALINKHETLFGTGIHGGSLFLPWHREYIWDLETLLKQVDCRVTVPYWRWTLEASAPFTSTIWDATVGIGGNSPSSGSCLDTGLFASPWVTPGGGCLKRDWVLSATYATEADISQALDVDCSASTQFTCMEGRIESFHNYIHGSIQGQMASVQSSNDPAFFLHHTYIDRLWARWQSKSSAHVTAYGGSTTTVHPGSTYTVADWLDLNRQANNANNRVCYVDPPNTWWVASVLDPTITSTTVQSVIEQATSNTNARSFNLQRAYQPLKRSCTTAKRVRSLSRIPLQPFPEKFLRATNMSDSMINELRSFHKARNNGTSVVSVMNVLLSRAPTAMMGFVLNDNDLACLTDDSSNRIVLRTTQMSASESSESFPSRTDPSQTDPSQTNPSQTNPSQTDPSQTDPSQTDSSQTDPAQTDSSQTDP